MLRRKLILFYYHEAASGTRFRGASACKQQLRVAARGPVVAEIEAKPARHTVTSVILWENHDVTKQCARASPQPALPLRQRQEGEEVLPAPDQALASLPPVVRTQAIVAGILGHWPTVEPTPRPLLTDTDTPLADSVFSRKSCEPTPIGSP